jgi:hypothetical protein
MATSAKKLTPEETPGLPGSSLDGAASGLAAIHDTVSGWLALPQQPDRFDGIDLVQAVVIANRISTDPCWLLIVAPPSSAKTELIQAVSSVDDVYPLSSLTPQTLASGFQSRQGPASLLPKLAGKVLAMKDFGTVLTLHRESRAAILAQLREVYDGRFVKEWGNGQRLEWAGKVGFLGGVTGIIDEQHAFHAVLGERFVFYRPPVVDEAAAASKAIEQQNHETTTRPALARLVRDYLATLATEPLPVIPAAIQEAVKALARFTARGRSPILCDDHGNVRLMPGIEGGRAGSPSSSSRSPRPSRSSAARRWSPPTLTVSSSTSGGIAYLPCVDNSSTYSSIAPESASDPAAPPPSPTRSATRRRQRTTTSRNSSPSVSPIASSRVRARPTSGSSGRTPSSSLRPPVSHWPRTPGSGDAEPPDPGGKRRGGVFYLVHHPRGE